MDTQKFDATLKSVLQDLEVPYDASTWSALESRLDALPAPDAVDRLVKPSLEHAELPYEPNTWVLLANKMDQVVLVRRIRRTKALELVIFLLLLSNLNGFFGVVGSVTKPKSFPKSENGPIAGLQMPQKKSPTSGSQKVYKGIIGAGLLHDIMSVAHQIGHPGDTNRSYETQLEHQSNANANEMAEVSAPSLLDPNRFYAQSGPVHFVDPKLVRTPSPKPILYATALPSIFGAKDAQKTVTRHFYVSTLAAFDQNTVREGTHTVKTSNVGGGFAAGYRNGKWGVETGMSYAQKTYQPLRQNVEYLNDPFQGIAFYYVDEVQSDVFTIPVKVTRKFANIGRTSAHAVAGVSTHIATSKVYRYETLHLPPPTPQPSPNPIPPPNAIFPEAKGILQDGGVNRNVFASADFGVRLEHLIGKRYVAFVEPAYRQSLAEGFGPGASRINSFTLQAGVMAHL